jgi:hypothetical protein
MSRSLSNSTIIEVMKHFPLSEPLAPAHAGQATGIPRVALAGPGSYSGRFGGCRAAGGASRVSAVGSSCACASVRRGGMRLGWQVRGSGCCALRCCWCYLCKSPSGQRVLCGVKPKIAALRNSTAPNAPCPSRPPTISLCINGM